MSARRTLADHPKGEQWVVAQVLRMHAEGAKGREIAAFVEFGEATVSNILIARGHRKKTPGARKPRSQVGLTHRRVCVDCGKIEMIRSDHKHTKRCRDCAKAVSTFKSGMTPHNAGARERRLTLKCATCGGDFNTFACKIEARPITGINHATYCSKACYGVAMQTPGSRYSEVGMNRKRGPRR